MVRKIITEPGRTFSEYGLLPGYTKKECTIPNISLETRLAGLELNLPFLSAAMTSVTGYEMALALGREGGIGILPARLSVKDQASIVRRVKGYEMSFVEEPLVVRADAPVGKVIKRMEGYGHRKIPVVDRYNVLLGLVTQENLWKSNVSLEDRATAAMIPFTRNGDIPYIIKPDITVEEVKRELERRGSKYIIILDRQKRVVKLAFKKDFDKIKVGAAISTHEGWKKRAKASIRAGADLIVVDTSDAYSEFVEEVVKEYKDMGTRVPLCVGNIVTYEGARALMEWGADIVKVGMSSGSICITQRQKAVGRAPMTALIDADKAREEFHAKRGRYVPLVMDGGVSNSADMVIALTIADALMMGGYFNKFFEAAAEKLDENRKVTTDETRMRMVATWGEGSERAMNLARYSQTQRTFFVEGVEGTTEYAGRLKPVLRSDVMKVRAALSNVGAMNLVEFRRNAVIEVNSVTSDAITRQPHHVDTKK